jgi:hypothetical protein
MYLRGREGLDLFNRWQGPCKPVGYMPKHFIRNFPAVNCDFEGRGLSEVA